MQFDQEQWFEEIMDEYGNALLKLAYHYVKDWARAEDIVQEVFVKVYNHGDTYRGESSFKTWIYRITINQCKDYLKSSFVRRTIIGTVQDWFNRPTETTPESEVIEQQERTELANCIHDLPIKYREVILFYYYEELTVPEIASLLAISENTVKTRLKRGRERLKEMLLKQEGEQWATSSLD